MFPADALAALLAGFPARLLPGNLQQRDHMLTYYWDLAVRQSLSGHLLIERTAILAAIILQSCPYRLDDLVL